MMIYLLISITIWVSQSNSTIEPEPTFFKMTLQIDYPSEYLSVGGLLG